MVGSHSPSQYYHGSVVYWLEGMSHVSLHWAWVCPHWGWYTHIFSNDCLKLSMRTHFPIILHSILYHIFPPLIPLLTSYFGDIYYTPICHTSKCHNCRIGHNCNYHTQVSHFSHWKVSHLSIGKCHISSKTLSPSKRGHLLNYEVPYWSVSFHHHEESALSCSLNSLQETILF